MAVNPGVIPRLGQSDGTLLERDRELARIRQCRERAREGRGSALVIEGPAGIGKSAALATSRNLAETGGFRVLRARGSELEREYAFGVVRQLFEPALAETPEACRASLLQGAPGVAARLLGFPGTEHQVAAAAPAAPDPARRATAGWWSG